MVASRPRHLLAGVLAAVLVAPVAAQDSGPAPIVAGDRQGTDTLTLEPADEPGLYRVPEVNAHLQLGVLPRTAERRLTLEAAQADAGHAFAVPQLPGVSVRVQPSGGDAIAIEFRNGGTTAALITASMTAAADDRSTPTLTMLQEPVGFLYAANGLTRALAIEGTSVQRRRIPGGGEVVAPLPAEGTVRITLRRGAGE